MTSISTLRDDHIIAQTSSYSCGPATLADLITSYLGGQATKDEITLLAEQTDLYRVGNSDGAQGISMSGLRDAARDKGYRAVGYRMNWTDVPVLLERRGVPLLIHLRSPQPHFALIVAVVDDLIRLSHPPFGETVLHKDDLLDRWDGLVLHVTADDGFRGSRQSMNSEDRDPRGHSCDPCEHSHDPRAHSRDPCEHIRAGRSIH